MMSTRRCLRRSISVLLSGARIICLALRRSLTSSHTAAALPYVGVGSFTVGSTSPLRRSLTIRPSVIACDLRWWANSPSCSPFCVCCTAPKKTSRSAFLRRCDMSSAPIRWRPLSLPHLVLASALRNCAVFSFITLASPISGSHGGRPSSVSLYPTLASAAAKFCFLCFA